MRNRCRRKGRLGTYGNALSARSSVVSPDDQRVRATADSYDALVRRRGAFSKFYRG